MNKHLKHLYHNKNNCLLLNIYKLTADSELRKTFINYVIPIEKTKFKSKHYTILENILSNDKYTYIKITIKTDGEINLSIFKFRDVIVYDPTKAIEITVKEFIDIPINQWKQAELQRLLA